VESGASAGEQLAARVSNRGRWDAEDPPCALALVTQGRIFDACALPRRGIVVACGVPPGSGAPSEVATRVVTPRPAPSGVAGRGVLLDLARAERRTRLDPGDAITPERLDSCAERLGVTIESGDLVLVRTGALGDARARDAWHDYLEAPSPGLALSCASWLHRREVALVACDARALQAIGAGARAPGPLEQLAHEETGVLLGFDFDLDALSRTCAEDGNYFFLWVSPPLRNAGANLAQPVALK